MTVATNLKDMIRLITSYPLQHDFVDAHIPNNGIPWDQLDKNPDQRAQQIHDHIVRLKTAFPDGQQKLIGALSVIASLNAEPGNQSYIVRELGYVKKLHERVTFYPFNCEHAWTIANLAAWINKMAAVDAAARLLWEELVGVAQTQQEKNNQWSIFNITPPTKKPDEFLAGITSFQEAFKVFEEGKGTSDDFDSEVFPSSLDNCVRYIINTTKPLRDVKMREKDKDGKNYWRVGNDNQQTGFIIDHYFARDYIAISRTVSGDEEDIARLFAENVLGSQIIDDERSHYDLAPFTSSKHREFLHLPAEFEKRGEHIWISGVEIVVHDRTNRQFPKFKVKECLFDKDDDIYTLVNCVMRPESEVSRDIRKVTITLRLWKRQFQNDTYLIDTSDYTDYIFTLAPNKLTTSPKLRNITDDFHYSFIKANLKNWRLVGINDPVQSIVEDSLS